MNVVLEIIAGPAAGRRTTVAPGAALRVGRNGDNDVVVADDPTMSRWHFELLCDGAACVVRDLNSRSGTFVNGRKIAGDEPARDQDELKAGLSRFLLKIDATPSIGEAIASPAGSTLASVSTPPPPDRESSSLNGYRGRLPLRQEPVEATLGRARLEADVSRRISAAAGVDESIAVLIDAGLIAEAIRLLAAAMLPHCAVRWACRCIRRDGVMSDLDGHALAAAERWAASPTEENRRAAQAVAEHLDYGTAAAWTAMAAFWSGGSMTPIDAPPVAPPDDLFPQAIYSAISLAAAHSSPGEATQRMSRFLSAELLEGLGE